MKLLADLIGAESYSGDYSAMIDVITRFLRKNTRADVKLQAIDQNKANVLALFGKPDLLINCHMDTVVPAGQWQFEPTQLKINADQAYGLGTTDTKGNIYALLMAAAAIEPKNVLFLLSTDEESGSIESGVTFFLRSGLKEGIKKAIICEPTSCEVVRRHKGYYSFQIRVQTRAGHSSTLDSEKSNAIVEAARFIPALNEAGFNVARISGGGQGNIIASACEINVSKRSHAGQAEIEARLRALLPPGTTLTARTALPPFDNAGIKGREVDFWTEASLFQNSDICSQVIGAGSIAQAHQQNEFVNLSQLEKMQSYFEALFREKI